MLSSQTIDNVVRSERAQMIRYLVRCGSQPEDAEDIMQDSLLRLVQHKGYIEKPGALLFKILKSVASHHHQSSIRTRTRLQEFAWAGCTMAGARCRKCLDPAKRDGLCPTHAMQEYRRRAA